MEDRFQTFTLLINKITRSIHKIKAEEMKKFDLKSAHVSCLYYLYQNKDGITSKELCECCEEDKALISRALEDLEKKGLVVCHSNKEKRYRSPLLLTDQGKEIGNYIAKRIDEVLMEASKDLSLEEKSILYKCLESISSRLARIGEKND
ncbi:MAG: MarR family transcriptional regulator [Anaeroplasmataceae bacterium]|nr:MarR family transcriptional regulator [Anaeroplasmataceae bacterium]